MNQIPTLHIPKYELLPDLKGWTNRFEIHSASSDRIYVISQNIQKRHWGCSCPSYRIRRYCKHLTNLGLPGLERPFEPNIIH